MKKNLGLFILLCCCCIITALINERFLHPYNLENLLRRTALFSIMSVGVSFVITSGGIDLSVGSLVCLVGTLLPWLCVEQGWPWPAALSFLLLTAVLIGYFHGILVTKVRLQPFIATLCGLLLYRGLVRGITADQTQGFGTNFETLRALSLSRFTFFDILPIAIPQVVFFALFIAICSGILMNKMVFGIHLRSIGRSDSAAYYSGINTNKLRIIAYILSALLAGMSGFFFILDVNSAQPSDFGNFYELYAIAAAVLGGCSLKGGEWSISGILLGTALMQILRNAIVLLNIPTQLEFAIIGAVILIGVSCEGLWKRKTIAHSS
jgi:ribose transport system permease protein